MSFFRNFLKYGFGAALSAGVVSVAAASDMTDAAQTAITSAETDGMTVGGYVVSAVAALVVVGLVLGLVRKV